MSFCKFCGRKIEWISITGGRPVAVDPEPVFVIEAECQESFFGGAGAAIGMEAFLDDAGVTIIGRQARPEEEHRDLPVAFVPHRRTCPWADKPVQRRVERGGGYGKG